jgi:hypothetical protein
MRGGLVVAVVVCKKYEEEAQGGAMPVAASHRKAFTALDGLVLRMLCEHCGVRNHHGPQGFQFLREFACNCRRLYRPSADSTAQNARSFFTGLRYSTARYLQAAGL